MVACGEGPSCLFGGGGGSGGEIAPEVCCVAAGAVAPWAGAVRPSSARFISPQKTEMKAKRMKTANTTSRSFLMSGTQRLMLGSMVSKSFRQRASAFFLCWTNLLYLSGEPSFPRGFCSGGFAALRGSFFASFSACFCPCSLRASFSWGGVGSGGIGLEG